MNKIIISSELFRPIDIRTFRLNFAIDIEDESLNQMHNFELIQKNGDRLQFDALIDTINWNDDYTKITVSGLITEMRKNRLRDKEELVFGLTDDEFMGNSDFLAEKLLELFKQMKKGQ